MNCKKCNQPLEDNALFCKECGYSDQVETQKAKVADLKNRAQGVVLEKCRSPLFLVSAICFSVMLLFQLMSVFMGGIVSIVTAILPTIFMIIALVGMWTTFGGRDKASLRDRLKKASIYDGYNGVILTIAYIAFIVLAAIFMIFALIAVINAMGTDYGWAAFGGIALYAFILVLIIVAMAIFAKLHKSRREYFISLAIYSDTGTYTATNSPVAGSFVIGIMTALSGISSFFSATLMGSAMTEMLEMMYDMGVDIGEFEEAFELIGSMGSTVAFAGIVSAIGTVALGAYYICTGLWMSSLHKEILINKLECNREEAALADIEKQKKSAVNAYEREKEFIRQREKEEAEAAERQRQKEAEEALARQREQEALEAKQAQEQQRLMMQMMMQQMMANSGMTPPAAAAPTADEAKIATLEREKAEAEAKAKQAEEMMKMMQQMMANGGFTVPEQGAKEEPKE